jgi:hypothetical protein
MELLVHFLHELHEDGEVEFEVVLPSEAVPTSLLHLGFSQYAGADALWDALWVRDLLIQFVRNEQVFSDNLPDSVTVSTGSMHQAS